ncbi:MAG: hypothetical protein Q7J73_09390 [Dehalococcoidales bacterium]|nr:hypothetical protein [Dehalococcoidales bacterium]
MGKQSKKKTAKLIRNTDRIRYPEDEAAYPWLSVLLDAYHIQETGISVELAEGQKKRKDNLACRRGCGTCCMRPTIPITEPEVKGIEWFVAKQLPADVRETVQAQLLIHRKTTQCPFLVNSVAVYTRYGLSPAGYYSSSVSPAFQTMTFISPGRRTYGGIAEISAAR